ncbi:MAG: hypothetical protein LBC58_03780 [Clostridiales Family XIII bacterium]|jgi:hypothetical protein|nr:hypothetical protein [Clostridiales Family XIII bacterium]
MKNNGKIIAAFILMGLVALIAGISGIVLIWYAGDFYTYLENYQYYMITVAGLSMFAFLLACCFAGGISSSNRREYRKLTAKLNEREATLTAWKAQTETAERVETAGEGTAEAPEQNPAVPEAPVRSEAAGTPAHSDAAAPGMEASPERGPSEPETQVWNEAVRALERIGYCAAKLKVLAEQNEKGPADTIAGVAAGAENPPVEVSATDVESLIGEIDDIAFRAHLLSLNIEIEKSNTGNGPADITPLAEEVRNIENRSASVAGRAGSIFSVWKNGAGGAPERDAEFAAGLREIARLSGDIQQAVAQLGLTAVPDAEQNGSTAEAPAENVAAEPGEEMEAERATIASPIDPSIGAGLY